MGTTEINVEEMVDNLWRQITKAILEDNPLFRHFRERWGEAGSTELVAKETLRRTREEMGVEGAMQYYSDPSLFMEKLDDIFVRHSEAVKRELMARELVIDGERIESLLSSHGAEHDYDVEKDIEESRKASELYREQFFRYERAFQKALTEGEFEKAEKLLEAIALTKKEDDLPGRVEVENWRIDLAAAKGDIEGFLNALQKASSFALEGAMIYQTSLEKCLRVLLPNSMINAVAVMATEELQSEEQKQINDIFWFSLVKKVAEALMKNPQVSQGEFKTIVRAASDRALVSLSLYPKRIKAEVVWH